MLEGVLCFVSCVRRYIVMYSASKDSYPQNILGNILLLSLKFHIFTTFFLFSAKMFFDSMSNIFASDISYDFKCVKVDNSLCAKYSLTKISLKNAGYVKIYKKFFLGCFVDMASVNITVDNTTSKRCLATLWCGVDGHFVYHLDKVGHFLRVGGGLSNFSVQNFFCS